MSNHYAAHHEARRQAARWHESKSVRSAADRRCGRCGEVHEFLHHGYCLGCVAEMAAQFDAENVAIKLAHDRQIAEQDIHDELRCN
jgi:hypothetical protein